MTLDELIDRLEEYRDAMGGDAEVRLMTQSNYPSPYTTLLVNIRARALFGSGERAGT
ncbi:MAG: hypothetical protein WD851_04505 [Pirellulales bacterium]